MLILYDLQGRLLRLEAHQVVSRQLEAQPTGCHTWRNLQKVGHDTLVHSSNTLLPNNDTNSVCDGLVLVAHAGHGVDLESSSQNITVKWSEYTWKKLERQCGLQWVSAGLGHAP